ncbi:MAG: hypothetical protein ACE148_16940 [Vicinamibacterales bacterium]
MTRVTALLASTFLFAATASAQQERFRVDFENGAAISGYNDARIPGDSGTKFSLVNDLDSEGVYFWRVRADVRLAPRHLFSALVAPLGIDASGSIDRPVSFAGGSFPAGVPVVGRYVFNSYRFTYRWEPIQTDTWRFGFGVTAKERDAAIRLESAATRAEKTDLGVVPLVNFRLERRLSDKTRLLVEGDALAAPQGRAEDIFTGVLVDVAPRLPLKAGYRFLEGGANNDEVYTFAMVHYFAVGTTLRF